MGASQRATIEATLRGLIAALGQERGADPCASFKAGDSEAAWVQVVLEFINFGYPFDDDPNARLGALAIAPLRAMRCVGWD